MRILEVWWHDGSPSIECRWAKAIAEIGILSPPRFGASDCRCPGHLFYVGEKHLENSAWNSSKKVAQGGIDRIELSKV
jgi:Uri superfamily endonuclease